MALLLVLNFLGRFAGLLLLDFLSGVTDLHSACPVEQTLYECDGVQAGTAVLASGGVPLFLAPACLYSWESQAHFWRQQGCL